MQRSDWIYLDNAATTRCSDLAIEVVERVLRQDYFNPSAAYRPSVALKEEMNEARRSILRLLRAEGTLIFTGGGTESDNLALLGTPKPAKSRVIVSAAEHAAVYRSAMELKQRGYDVVEAPVDGRGAVVASSFEQLLTPDTSLVSVMHVNNETGAVNDLDHLVRLTCQRAPRALFHSDGVQAMGKINVNLTRSGVDLYSVSAHKLHAPKGLGALYIRKGVHLKPIVFGGGQEEGLRSSTENVAAILAFGAMAKDCLQRPDRHAAVLALKQQTQQQLAQCAAVRLIGAPDDSPYILALVSHAVRGEVMQHALEEEGILVGTGSACSANKASRRIAHALGLVGKEADGMVRVSFSAYNTQAEIQRFTQTFCRLHGELEKYGN